MFNSYITHTVGTDVYLDKIFQWIPSNAFINKGRCGIGGTTLELKNVNRCSIIVAPTIGILKDKKKSNPTLFIVYGEVPIADVKEQLSLKEPAQKIMVTPEGFKKLMNAAIELGMDNEFRDNWFLLLDESHTFISEHYRKGILTPFNYFFSFKNKAIISATPYHFTDERFRTLDYHNIVFTGDLGIITLVHTYSIAGTLDYVITASLVQDGRLHIFLNSVTEIGIVIKRLGLKACSIYCADDKEHSNLKKLSELTCFYHEQPDQSNFSKVNFYTSKYFEGWDLFDDQATVVVVSDIHSEHTKVSVGMKLKQAVGRLRNTPMNILHITNSYGSSKVPKSAIEFEHEYYMKGNLAVEQHNVKVEYYKAMHIELDKDFEELSRYADIDPTTKIATLNKLKIDQLINQATSSEVYNNINLIKQAWEAAYYKVNLFTSHHILQTNTTLKRKSKAQQLKEDYQTIIAHRRQQASELQFYFGSPEDNILITNPLAYQAAQFLKEAQMETLKYNIKQVEAEVILASNTHNDGKLKRLLLLEFKRGGKYSNDDIKTKLQSIYNQLAILDLKTGNVVKAKAVDLGQVGWFDIEKCKLADKQGRYTVHGFQVLRPQFELLVAA